MMLDCSAPLHVYTTMDALHYLPMARAPLEAFFMLFLSVDFRYLGMDMLIGSVSSTPLRAPGFYITRARELDARLFIAAHTHPWSGPGPSGNDLALTSQLRNTLTSSGFILLDHIIIGSHSWYSMRYHRQLPSRS